MTKTVEEERDEARRVARALFVRLAHARGAMLEVLVGDTPEDAEELWDQTQGESVGVLRVSLEKTGYTCGPAWLTEGGFDPIEGMS